MSDFCVEHGSNGVVVEDESADIVRVRAYFPAEQWKGIEVDLGRFLLRLSDAFPELPAVAVSTTKLKAENWALAWKIHFKSIEIGNRLVVTPPWITPEARGREVIIIDPADAFGTGTHETTQGCMALLEEAVAEFAHPAKRFTMLDVGCGSGILAIAGIKLGASGVRGIDNDPVAIEAAARNAALNGVADGVFLECLSVAECTEPADIVTANLDPMGLLSHKDQLMALARRFLIISGVPLDQWERVRPAFQTSEFSLLKEITRSEWGSGLFGRNRY